MLLYVFTTKTQSHTTLTICFDRVCGLGLVVHGNDSCTTE